MSETRVWHDEADRLATWGTLDPTDGCMCTDCVLGSPDLRLYGVSAELAAARLKVAMGGCPHAEPVPVVAGGEVVAHLCPDCDAQLPAEWDG